MMLRFFYPAAPLCLLAVATIGCSSQPRVFELRTYTAAEGRLDDLNARFRDHTCAIFARHGMEMIGFWTPTDGDKADNTLVYLLAYPSRDAAKASWQAFFDDADWKAARKASVANGPLVTKVESEFLTATDYSATK